MVEQAGLVVICCSFVVTTKSDYPWTSAAGLASKAAASFIALCCWRMPSILLKELITKDLCAESIIGQIALLWVAYGPNCRIENSKMKLIMTFIEPVLSRANSRHFTQASQIYPVTAIQHVSRQKAGDFLNDCKVQFMCKVLLLFHPSKSPQQYCGWQKNTCIDQFLNVKLHIFASIFVCVCLCVYMYMCVCVCGYVTNIKDVFTCVSVFAFAGCCSRYQNEMKCEISFCVSRVKSHTTHITLTIYYSTRIPPLKLCAFGLY